MRSDSRTLEWRSSIRRVLVAGGAAGGIAWLGLALFLAAVALAPMLPLQDPVKPGPAESLQPPSAQHWFGTDSYGMDVFSRTIHAARTDFVLAVASVLIGIAVGVPLGAVTGYIGGFADDVLTRIAEIIQGFPLILFAMAVMAATGTGLSKVVLICALYNGPLYLKMVRSVVVSLREVEFVEAARCAGNSTTSVIFRHIAPNALVPVFSQFPISSAAAMRIIAGLSFIGLGVRIPNPEWGSMISLDANHVIFGKWWPSVFPGLAIFSAMWVLTSISDQIKSIYVQRA